MPNIVNLDELLPEDIHVRYQGKDYALPGDIDVETVFRLFELFRALSGATFEGEDEEILEQIKGRFGDIRAELLKLFQIRQPELESLPFGIRSIGVILRVILEQLGLKIQAEDPPTPSRPSTKTRRAPNRKTSRRSTGSK